MQIPIGFNLDVPPLRLIHEAAFHYNQVVAFLTPAALPFI
jgi:hypothetical protein